MFRQLTPITKAIIILNVIIFLLSFVVSEDLMGYLAAYFPLSKNFKYWQIITHMFVHGGFMHLLFNMFTLLSFGPVLEKVLGEKKFLWFYFACGLGSFVIYNIWIFLQVQGYTNALIESGINPAEIYAKAKGFKLDTSYVRTLTPDGFDLYLSLMRGMVGASGAIFGVVAAFSLLFPNAELIFMFIPFPVKAKYLFPLIVVGSLFLGIQQYEGDNIAHFAHLGGALIGALWIMQWRKSTKEIIRFKMKLLRFLLLVIHLVVLLLLLATPINAIIKPQFLAFANFLSLAFPVLIMLHFLLIVVWIILWKKRAFVFIFFSLFLIKPIGRWIQLGNKKIPPTENTIKLLSFNTKNGSGIHNDSIINYLEKHDFDIMLFQESGYKQIKFGEKYHAFYNESGLISVLSKYPILQVKDILDKQERREVGDAVLLDIDINGQKLRLITFYLNSFLVKKEMVKPTSDVDKNERKYKTLAGKMMNNFRIHQREIETILPYIENSPYPVIVAGDLNAVPNSYEYYQLSKLLKDTFVESGNGSGTSFHDFKFPIRIDYIFTSKNIQTSNYKVNRNVRFSDHFPVSVEFNLPK